MQRDDQHKPVSVKELALSLGKKAWRSVTWREGSNAPLASRFAAVRVHLAARDYKRTTPHPVEWLLVEWPKGEAAPTKYWLSTLPEDTPLATLVDYAKLRWRIERDYEELKGELGLSHYEGRGWRGFHHHATLCIAAYGFLISERDAIPPSASWRRTMPRLPEGYRPRGAADPSRTPRRKLDRDDQKTPHRRARKIPRAMSMLSVDATTACNLIGRSAIMCMAVSRVGDRNLTLPERRSLSTSPWDLEAEILTLHRQLNVLQRKSPKRLVFGNFDRLVFAGLYRIAPGVLNALVIVKPEAVIGWHRAGFRLFWRWKSRRHGGRPRVPLEIRQLIREMSLVNPLWGAPRIHGELLKLGIEIGHTISRSP